MVILRFAAESLEAYSRLIAFKSFSQKPLQFCCAELAVGMNTEGIDVRSVGNTLTLHDSALIEAFNLQAAIEYQLKHCEFYL